MRGPETDFWKVGIVPLRQADCLREERLSAVRDRIIWLPDPGRWRYLADPFGRTHGRSLHVFVEAFDYRTKHAVIEHHHVDLDRGWLRSQTVLARPFHLSYPFIIEHAGEVFMVPESHRAGEIALYRARAFPGDWVREKALLPGIPGAEPSLIFYQRRWWMFFTIVGPQARDQRELYVAWADTLTGPWQLHPRNPIIDNRSGARPGGTPFVDATGRVILPVQDCHATYGGGLRFLRFEILEPDEVRATHLEERLDGGTVAATHREGLHTLAGAGEYSFLDVKRIDRSRMRHWINCERRVRRLFWKPVTV